MVRICHFSDWHCQWSNLPEADVYVSTGDMLDNYPIIKRDNVQSFGSFGPQWTRKIDHEKEERLQLAWFEKKFKNKGRTLRCFIPESCRDNPVVVVRGNHDFTDLGPMFGGNYFEVHHDASRSIEFCGLKFGGFRGIPMMIGEWADELMPEDFEERVNVLPDDLDVVCTHAPPNGILDGWGNQRLGVQALASWINAKQYDGTRMPKLFCFGHIHERFGTLTADDGTVFSNAATGCRVIDVEV